MVGRMTLSAFSTHYDLKAQVHEEGLFDLYEADLYCMLFTRFTLWTQPFAIFSYVYMLSFGLVLTSISIFLGVTQPCPINSRLKLNAQGVTGFIR